MNPTWVRAFTLGAIALGAIILGAAVMAYAQQTGPSDQSVDRGKWEYDGHCAVCHGSTGKGDGYFYAGRLEKSTIVPDLTELSKKNNGVFPFARVYETIDGRRVIHAHGTRDMPIWGRDFSAMSFTQNLSDNHEALARAKILALTEYIYRLQAK